MDCCEIIEEEETWEENQAAKEEQEVDLQGFDNGLRSPKLSWKKFDSFDMEADSFTSNQSPRSSQVIPRFVYQKKERTYVLLLFRLYLCVFSWFPNP